MENRWQQMTTYLDHHNLAILSCCSSALELLSTQPSSDAVCELRELLEAQFDIVNCVIQDRHYGSDELDSVIEFCHDVANQVKLFEEK